MINFSCTDCTYTKSVPNEFSGKKVRCPKCKSVSRVLATTSKATSSSLVVANREKPSIKPLDKSSEKRFDKDKLIEQSKSAAIISCRKLNEIYVYLKPHGIRLSKQAWEGTVYCVKTANEKFKEHQEATRQRNADIQEARHQEALRLEEIRQRLSSGMKITPEESLLLRNSQPAQVQERASPPTSQATAALGVLSLAFMFGVFFICCGGGIFGVFLGGGSSSASHPYGYTDAEAMEHGERILNGEVSFWDDPRDTPARGSAAWYEDDDVKYSDKVIEYTQGKTWDDFK